MDNRQISCCGGTHCEVSQAQIENTARTIVEICEKGIRADERRKVLEVLNVL